jgi:hypothetical protein
MQHRNLFSIIIAAVASLSIAAPAAADCEPHWDTAAGNPGMNGPVFALTVGDIGSGPTLYTGGQFTQSGPNTLNYVGRWEPGVSQWLPLGSGTNNVVNAVKVFGSSLYVGGAFWFGDNPNKANHSIAHWNGSQWLMLAGGIKCCGHVRALEVFDDGAGDGRQCKVQSGCDAEVQPQQQDDDGDDQRDDCNRPCVHWNAPLGLGGRPMTAPTTQII